MDEVGTEPRGGPQRWLRGEFGVPSLVVLLLVLAGLGLGAASIGGWAAIVLVLIVMVAFVRLMFAWIAAPRSAGTQPK